MAKKLTREQRNKLDCGGGCSVCTNPNNEPVIEAGEHYWLCESCARGEIEELHRAKELIELLTFHILNMRY
jgi:hypothetical protein